MEEYLKSAVLDKVHGNAVNFELKYIVAPHLEGFMMVKQFLSKRKITWNDPWPA